MWRSLVQQGTVNALTGEKIPKTTNEMGKKEMDEKAPWQSKALGQKWFW